MIKSLYILYMKNSCQDCMGIHKITLAGLVCGVMTQCGNSGCIAQKVTVRVTVLM